MDFGNYDEQILWSAMLQGDKASFSGIHDLYYGHLITYAQRFTQDALLAGECIQDLFVKIWTNRVTIGTPASVRFYLFKAFRHILYNKLSAIRKERSVGSLEDFMPFNLSLPERPDNEPSERVRQLLRSLTPRQQEAVYLYYFEGLSYQEVADVLQMQLGGTYKLIYRALDNMRAHADMISIVFGVFLQYFSPVG
jgi:RNA polymerase sigma factor (sigma-70 family)